MWLDSSNTTMQQENVFKKLLDQDELLNPVVGFRFGPPNAKMTIGALDPDDYEGELNWVPATGKAQVSIDGYFGKNGSQIPFNGNASMKADLSSGKLASPCLSGLRAVCFEFELIGYFSCGESLCLLPASLFR